MGKTTEKYATQLVPTTMKDEVTKGENTGQGREKEPKSRDYELTVFGALARRTLHYRKLY